MSLSRDLYAAASAGIVDGHNPVNAYMPIAAWINPSSASRQVGADKVGAESHNSEGDDAVIAKKIASELAARKQSAQAK